MKKIMSIVLIVSIFTIIGCPTKEKKSDVEIETTDEHKGHSH